MTYKKINPLFFICYIALSVGAVLLVAGAYGVFTYSVTYGQLCASIPPNIDQTEHAWAVVPFVSGPVFVMMGGACVLIDGWPKLRNEYYTLEEQEAMENDYMDIMREKGFTFNEDKDVL